jgi:UDPglucose 6-dehydrogenase
METLSVTVVGLGKLGAPLAVCFASRGLQVYGVDADPQTLAALRNGQAPVYEPGLQALLDEHRQRMTFTADVATAVEDSQATFVLVSTPSNAAGHFSLEQVLSAARAIGAALAKKRDYHLVVIASTVSPGAIENHILPELERASGKQCGKDFGLCHSPEFVALGAVVQGYLRPDFALIGQFDERSGDLLEAIYRRYFPQPTPCVRTNLVSAELAKLALNTFLTVKISFANVLAEVCERTPGADAAQISAAIGHDRRIGPAYLKGALSYGGPCFPRDVAALSAACHQAGVSARLPETVQAINDARHRQVLALVERQLAARQDLLCRPACVAVLGLAFKPDTDVTIASPSLELARSLQAAGHPLLVHDPVARVQGMEGIQPARAEDAIAAADVIVIATPWEEYRRLPVACWQNKVLVDCWRHLRREALPASLTYIPLGVSSPTRILRRMDLSNRDSLCQATLSLSRAPVASSAVIS